MPPRQTTSPRGRPEHDGFPNVPRSSLPSSSESPDGESIKLLFAWELVGIIKLPGGARRSVKRDRALGVTLTEYLQDTVGACLYQRRGDTTQYSFPPNASAAVRLAVLSRLRRSLLADPQAARVLAERNEQRRKREQTGV